MTGFVALAALLAAAALAFLLPPLLRTRAPTAPAAREDANAAIYREQLAELEADHARGAISAEAHALARRELERRIVAEAAPAPAPAARAAPRPRAAAIAVALFVPLAAALGYWKLGNPAAIGELAAIQAARDVTPEQMRALTEQLWQRMHASPEDPQGWLLLGRSLAVFGDHERAAQAYARAAALLPNDASLLADYADALAMARGQKLAGEPFELVKRALALEPEHVKALALAGSAAFERGDYAGAVGYWTRALKQAPPESEFARSIEASIDEAGRLAGAAAPRAGTALQGVVSLDPALSAHVAPDDTVFVIARAAGGGRVPLAVARTTVSQLPYRFTLDDSMAMAPGAKISGHKQVVVAARVSRTGEAAPAKGDIEGSSAAVAPGTTDVSVRLSRIRD